MDWISHPTLTHADTPEKIDVVLVNGDPNPNRPDLPHYGAGETDLQADDRGGGQRDLRCDRRSAAPRAVQGCARARGVEDSTVVVFGFSRTVYWREEARSPMRTPEAIALAGADTTPR